MWLGVDIVEFLKDSKVMNDAVSMTGRDRVRAISMLGRKELEVSSGLSRSGVQTVKPRSMLQCMLMLNVKMEIQAVDKTTGGLCSWLTEKILAVVES